MSLHIRSHRHASRRDHHFDTAGSDNFNSPGLVLPKYDNPSYIKEELSFKRTIHFTNDRPNDNNRGSSGPNPVKRSWGVEVNALDTDGNPVGRTKRFTVSQHPSRPNDYDNGYCDPATYSSQRRHGYLRWSRRNDRSSGNWGDSSVANGYSSESWARRSETYEPHGDRLRHRSGQPFDPFPAQPANHQDGNNFGELPRDFYDPHWDSFNGANVHNRNYYGGGAPRNQYNQGYPPPTPVTHPLDSGRQDFARPAMDRNHRWGY